MRGACLAAGLLAAVSAFAAEEPQQGCLYYAAAATGPAEPAVSRQLDQARARVVARPNQGDPRGRLGMILHAYEAFAAAEACYGEAVALDPGEPRWLYYHAVALAKLGRPADALAELDRLLGLQSQMLPAVLLRAELLMLLGDVEASEVVWRQALSLDARNARAHFGLGQSLAARGLDTAAAAAFERSVALESSSPSLYALAQAYRRLDRVDDAKRALASYQRMAHAAEASPENALLAEVAALNRSVRRQVGRGVLLARLGRTEEAVAEFEAAIRANPGLVAPHANLISLYAGAGDLDRAASSYRRAIGLDSNSPDAHYNWGGALAQRGRWEEASGAFEQAVASAPHFAEGRVRLGQAYERLGRSEAAAAQYREALNSDPLHREARRLLGAALIEQGKLEEGLDHLERAVDLGDGRTAAYLEGLSRAHEADGRAELALGYARRALRRAEADGPEDLVGPLKAAIARLEAKR